MAATYSSTLATAKDRVRSMVMDTKSPWVFQDEEITAVIAAHRTERLAAASLCDRAAIYFSQHPTKQGENDGEGFEWTDRVRAYQAMAKQLRSEDARVTSGQKAVIGRMAADGIEDLHL